MVGLAFGMRVALETGGGWKRLPRLASPPSNFHKTVRFKAIANPFGQVSLINQVVGQQKDITMH